MYEKGVYHPNRGCFNRDFFFYPRKFGAPHFQTDPFCEPRKSIGLGKSYLWKHQSLGSTLDSILVVNDEKKIGQQALSPEILGYNYLMVFCCLKWDPLFLWAVFFSVFCLEAATAVSSHTESGLWAPTCWVCLKYSAHLVHEDTRFVFLQNPAPVAGVYPITILLFTGFHSYE